MFGQMCFEPVLFEPELFDHGIFIHTARTKRYGGQKNTTVNTRIIVFVYALYDFTVTARVAVAILAVTL